ncbi:Attractin-Like Protein 1 [Manis pentadactyla]|nr:Attractin-Like Protein 1 [Manis pentadactyla]
MAPQEDRLSSHQEHLGKHNPGSSDLPRENWRQSSCFLSVALSTNHVAACAPQLVTSPFLHGEEQYQLTDPCGYPVMTRHQ